MRAIPYEAAGRITREALRLRLKGATESFDVSGKAAPPSPKEPKERGG